MTSPRERREATIWRALRIIYLRAAGHYTGRDLLSSAPQEQEAVLDRWHRYMENDLEILREIVENARAQGLVEAQRVVHQLEGIDHDLVDEGIQGVRERELTEEEEP